MTDRIDINRFLVEMRNIKAQTQAFNHNNSINPKDAVSPVNNAYQSLVGSVDGNPRSQFSEVFTQAIDKVNETQKASTKLATAYEQGDPTVDITQVMVASQKASVSFQAMVQVRNKLVDAYRDIMNMPI